MKLDMVRLPHMGLPSAGTPVTVTDTRGRPITSAEAAKSDPEATIVLRPEEATALLTTANGTRFELPVREIVTGPIGAADDEKSQS